MSERDADAIATIALIAALADGRRQPQERAQLARVADLMGGGDFGRMTRLVLAGQLRLADVVARLDDAAGRLEAFETAVTICYADDVATET
jgi:DnaJ-domain-containing protein 1